MIIDGLQFCNWSREIFCGMKKGEVAAAHATVAYHENCREAIAEIAAWNRRFQIHSDLIIPAGSAADVRRAIAQNKTGIILGFQNCSPIEDDLSLVEVFHKLGVRFMQLTYNNQSLLGGGCYEPNDGGLSRFGIEVIKEMNRVGMAVDMSHSGERSTLEAIEISARPIAITHANPSAWHPCERNKSNNVLRALWESGGVLGFSFYAPHLRGGSECTLDEFCEMAAQLAEAFGVGGLAIGSDLCQDRGSDALLWMRNGRWRFPSSQEKSPRWPSPPSWFRSNSDFTGVAGGLRKAGFNQDEIDAVMGGNWLNYFEKSFGPANDK